MMTREELILEAVGVARAIFPERPLRSSQMGMLADALEKAYRAGYHRGGVAARDDDDAPTLLQAGPDNGC